MKSFRELIVLIVLCWTPVAGGVDLVLYPEAPQPYQDIFAQIISGIDDSRGTAPLTRAIPERYNLDDIEQWINTHQDGDATLITLGSRAFDVGQKLSISTGLPQVVGAIESLPDQIQSPGVSVIIDPELFINTLKTLVPSVRNVIVVHNVKNSALIPFVEQAARSENLTIQPVMVTNAADAVRKITRIFDTIELGSTAIWFTQHTISLDTELMFPFIMESTWYRRIPAFSDTLAYTRRGLFFALYPDYVGMGKQLGEKISNTTPGLALRSAFTFSRASQLAINTRTAQNLGITLSRETLDQAGVIFPAR